MSLLGILNLSGSALAAQQAALQTTGNNIANAANPNYTREVTNFVPNGDVVGSGGVLVGSGVSIASIQRQVDQSLNERLRGATSDQSSATTLQSWSGQVQSVFNALSGNGVSDQLNTFFNDWSSVANNPSDLGQRQVVIQDGKNVASTLNGLASNLNGLTTTLNGSIGSAVQQVNQLTSSIATLNQQIVSASAGGSQQPNSLLDQRDADLSSLSQLVNIQTIAQPAGSVNVYLGSESLVQNTTSNALSSTTVSNGTHIDSTIAFADGTDATSLINSGQIGGMLQSQSLIDTTGDSVNSLAGNLISSLNTLYSSGQGLSGYSSVTATNSVADPTQPLSSSASGLTTFPTTGSFVIHLTDKTTGLSTSSLIPINGTGTTTPTTLNSLQSSLNSVTGVSATINNGALSISSTNPNVQISFSQDTSGTLASLGINTFFSGTNALNIGVNSQLAGNASLLAASANGNPDDNTTALAISALNDAPQAGLNGASLSDSYGTLVENIGSSAANATNNVASTNAVQQTLSAQRQTLSGVSTDEEALNMIMQQRSYQGAAELITIINKMMDTLLAIA
jgi:flagellar hook-associated protein 1 FlgK